MQASIAHRSTTSVGGYVMASAATSPRRQQSCCRLLAPPRRLHDELLVDEILTRLPVAAAVRFRVVCRAWNKALTSDHFLQAHHARLAAARQTELLFLLPPPAAGAAASLYAFTLGNGGEPPSAARELLTLQGNSLSSSSEDQVLVLLSPRPCHGLTLILDARHCCYYICNVSTGQHAALPPCEPPAMCSPSSRIRMGFHLRLPPWTPCLEISTAGLGFNHATGQHKVVRLFKTRIGETTCAVCALGRSATGWRPCAGRVPPHAASFVPALPPVFIAGSLYWLLDSHQLEAGQPAIMSFSMDDEQFGWVPTPPLLSRRICHLTDLDGSLCATVDLRHMAERYAIFTWSGAGAWSVRCSINLQSLPRQIADEFVEEKDVVPLCSAGPGRKKKILLATGRHKVFAYDPERDSMERLVYMLEFVDIPRKHREAPLLLNIGLHEERIACVHDPTPPNSSSSKSRLHVRRGSKTLGKRQVSNNDYRDRDDRFRQFRDLFKEMAGLPRQHI